ncbi:MAG: glycine cleavage system protein GcvH [Pseudomonadota bacterium]
MNFPEGLKYTNDHEWIRVEDDGSVTIGVSEYATENLGDIVFVELPQLESSIAKGESCGVIESVKAVSDIFSPVDGIVTEVNDLLTSTPEILSEDAYNEGWIFKCQTNDISSINELMEKDAYEKFVEELS